MTLDKQARRRLAKLDQRTVKELQAGDRTYAVPDSTVPGLEVRVSPDGTKSFSLRYRLRGDRRVRRIHCGTFGETTLHEARDLALDYKRQAKLGQDPAEPQRTRREAPSVRELGEVFLQDCATRLKPSTLKGYHQMWTTHILKAFGTAKITELSAKQVGDMHRGMHETPYAANRVLALLSSFFNFAERQGYRPRHTNPTEDIKPYKEDGRETFLNDEQIGALWSALARADEGVLKNARPRTSDPERSRKHSPRQTLGKSIARGYSMPANPAATDAIRLILLTGCREGEVLSLRWADVDTQRRVMFLGDTKTGRSTRPLSDSAIEVIERQRPRSAGLSPFVFPSTRDATQPLTDISRLWASVRKGARLEGVRMHDLRHTVASLLANSGASLHEIASVLGHKDTTTTRRYAHLTDLTMLQRANEVAEKIVKAIHPEQAQIRGGEAQT